VVLEDNDKHETQQHETQQHETIFDQEAFIKEFWEIVQKQNQKIDILIVENSSLKASIEQTNNDLLKYKQTNNKVIQNIKNTLDVDAKQK
jgi:hypothetical protein